MLVVLCPAIATFGLLALRSFAKGVKASSHQPLPKGPCERMVNTWALKGFLYPYCGVYVCTIRILRRFGSWAAGTLDRDSPAGQFLRTSAVPGTSEHFTSPGLSIGDQLQTKGLRALSSGLPEFGARILPVVTVFAGPSRVPLPGLDVLATSDALSPVRSVLG